MTIASTPPPFSEFFEMGLAESSSPFLTPASRKWAFNLPLKAAILAAILLACSFGLSFYSSLVPISQLILVFVYFLAGTPALIESLEDLIDGEVNIDVLMTLAAYSSVFIGSGLEGGLLLVLFAISGAMEEAVTAKAKGAISSLHRLAPTKACVVEDSGHLIERSISDIQVGTLILIKSGEIVPLDGKVVQGASSINLVHLTGESLPISVQVGNEVAAGAYNLEGALTVQVTQTSNDSTLARIISLVTQAQEARPRLQRWFDRLSRGYALTIIGFSALFAISLPYLLDISFLGHEGSLYRALAFLIAASPCALILAIPIAYLSAISACAKQGILLKGGVTLDALASCQAIAFDKTGTLTTGELLCLQIEALQPSLLQEQEVLSIAYALERNAVHPIARAITAYAVQKNVTPIPLDNFKTIAGYGVQGIASINNQETSVYLGSLAFIQDKVDPGVNKILQSKLQEVQTRGELTAFLLVNQELFLFRFGDQVRQASRQTIQELRHQHQMQVLMLTGDHLANAQRIAQMVGLDEFHAELRPQDKMREVSTLAEQKGLIMVGDGINDAPALARATVGICMGQVGSGAAIEAADVVLLQDNIDKLSWLLSRAHLTKRIVAQNLTLAVAAILFASLPALAGAVPLWLAVIMHEGGTVLVGLNALRLLKK